MRKPDDRELAACFRFQNSVECSRSRLIVPLVHIPLIILASLVLLGACSPRPRPQERAEAELVTFTDVTRQAGLDFQHGAFHWDVSGDPVAMMGGGLCWLDFDNDGWLDLYAVNSYAVLEAGRWEKEGGLPTNALYRNDRGHFTDVSSRSGADLVVRGNGCVAADFDLDGWTDLYITTARFNLMLMNNGGDGTFREIGQAAGVDSYGWQTGAVVGDLNGDGWPDLFVAGYVDINNRLPNATRGFPNSHYGQRDLLYLNQGPGPTGELFFREVGELVGLETRDFEYGLGALLSDFDLDGDLDLLVANDTNPNRLYENVPWPGGAAADPANIGFRFAEIGQYAGVGDRNSGMGVAGGDYDNDGRIDLMITNMGAQYHSVYQNQAGDQFAFRDATTQIGVAEIGVGWTGWGISWADADLDTDLDLFIANGAIPVLSPSTDVQQLQFFANLTAQGMPGLFQDLTAVAGFYKVAPQIARGAAVADYDNDGDPDLAINAIAGQLVLLRNEQVGGRWLTVALEGHPPGARVAVTLPDGRELFCETRAGSSYLASEDPRCHFGLGGADRVAELLVIWPDGRESRLTNLPADQQVNVGRPAGGAAPVDPAGEMFASVEDFLFRLSLIAGGAEPLEVLPAASTEQIRLGEALFWDRELSGSRDVSCATCHHPAAGTGDGLSLSIGVGGVGFGADRILPDGPVFIPRNAPEIYNRGAAGWTTMFWDNRVSEAAGGRFHSPAGEALPDGFENVVAVQAMFPVTSRDEMRGHPGERDVEGEPNELSLIADEELPDIWAALIDRLLTIPGYATLFEAAYPDVPQEWLGFQHAASAIAAYEMAVFTFDDSPWDRYLRGEEDALTPAALEGARLFYGEAGCSQCHNGSLLTDQQVHNIGVPQVGPGKGDEAPQDLGRGRLTGDQAELYAFRTPPLRNVAISGPWMHNGAYTSLGAAVRHHLDPAGAFRAYDPAQLHPAMGVTYQLNEAILGTLDPLLDAPIELSDAEIEALLAFLEALTSPRAGDFCAFVPASVPSGLPIDLHPDFPCRSMP